MLLFLAGCRRGPEVKAGEAAYVAVPQTSLRDRVAAVFNKTGTLNNGERVDVLEHSHNGRFVRVRSSRGEEGWVEQRYLASEDVFNGFQKLVRENGKDPVQARAIVKADLNMHLEPSRDSEHLFQLKEGEKLDLLKRAVAEKTVKGISVKPKDTADKTVLPPPVLEDWWLVRNANSHYGWVLARMVDLDIPLEVAQYSEGQRIIADFVLNTVDDHGKAVPQYLLLLNEPKDGSEADFNQARIFTWNLKMHRYETAYRERNLNGMLPAEVRTESFGKEGSLPVFLLHTRSNDGTPTERKYKLNGVRVRRVLSPQEEEHKQPVLRH